MCLIEVLGSEFDGVLGCDYFSSYRRYQREFGVLLQFCLAGGCYNGPLMYGIHLKLPIIHAATGNSAPVDVFDQNWSHLPVVWFKHRRLRAPPPLPTPSISSPNNTGVASR